MTIINVQTQTVVPPSAPFAEHKKRIVPTPHRNKSIEAFRDRCNNIVQRKNTLSSLRTIQEKTAALNVLLLDFQAIQTDVESLKPQKIRTCNPLIYLECKLVEKVAYFFAYSKAAKALEVAVRAHEAALAVLHATHEQLQLFAIQETQALKESLFSDIETLPYLEKLASLSSNNSFVKEQLALYCFKLRLFDEAKKMYLALSEEQKDKLEWKEKLLAIAIEQHQYQQAERTAMDLLAAISKRREELKAGSLLSSIGLTTTNKTQALQELVAMEVFVTQHLSQALTGQERFSDAINQLTMLLARHKLIEAPIRHRIITIRIEEALSLAKTLKSPKQIHNARLFSQALYEFSQTLPSYKATQAEFAFWVFVYQNFPKVQEIDSVKKYITNCLLTLGRGKCRDLNPQQILIHFSKTVLTLKEQGNTLHNSMEKASTLVATQGDEPSLLIQAMKKELAKRYEVSMIGAQNTPFSSILEQRSRLSEIYSLFKNNVPQVPLLTKAFNDLARLT